MLSGALNAAGAGLMLSEDPGSVDTGSDLRDDCSRSSSGDDVAAPAAAAAAAVDTRSGPPQVSIYAPPSNSIDYCNALACTPPPRRDYCSSAVVDSGAFSMHAPPEVGLSSYACAASAGWSSHLRSPQLASLMVAAAAAGAMLPTDSHSASSLAM